MARRYELSDSQWEAIRSEPPGKAGDPGRTAEDDRRFVDAVSYVARTGVPRPDLPERFGRPNTVWKRFDHWCRAGVWERLAGALGEPDLAELQLDSTTVKARPVAATGRRRAGEKKTRPTPGDASAGAG